MKDKATLLEFGKGGHTLYLKKESSGMAYCQGYASPDTFCKPYHWWADPPEKMSTHWDNYEIPAEGIPVVDVTEAVKTDAGYKWVLLGPMYSPEVQDREADDHQCHEPIHMGKHAEPPFVYIFIPHLQGYSIARECRHVNS